MRAKKQSYKLVLLMFCLGVFIAPAAAQTKRLNVLFIVADDLRPAPSSGGAYGDRAAVTPHLERLAKRGVRFDRAYVQYPVCNPSRVSFLTGLRPETARVLDNTTFFRRPLPDIVTLPQLFKQQGYFTASLGKIFHRGGTMEEVNEEWADPASWSHVRFYQSTARGKQGEGRNLTGGALKWCQWLAAEGTDEDQPDGQVAAEAVRLLNEKRNEPFFLGVGFHKPHDPFIAPKKYFDLYPLDKLTLPRDPAQRSADEPLAIPPNQFTQFKAFTDQERREFKRAYLAGLSFMDAQLGKVLDALDRNQLWESTIIVFIGDHGYHLGERNWWNKNTLFELSARAPLLVYAPGAKGNGKSSQALVEFVDLYPTLAALAGLSAPHKLAGMNLKPLLDVPAGQGKPAAMTVVTRGKSIGRSIRTTRWRYTEWDDGARGVELYDHRNDAGEYRNLARDAKHAGTVAELKKLLATQK
jgi:iduronate 2-sulfatase